MEKERRREVLIKLARECAKILKDKFHVKRVFLIGSPVYGIVHEKSDIDLVVEGLRPELYIKALVELSDFLQWKVEVNLIPFEDAFESLKERTKEKGMLIYG